MAMHLKKNVFFWNSKSQSISIYKANLLDTGVQLLLPGAKLGYFSVIVGCKPLSRHL
jgi:hypothetical protein